MNLVTHVLQKNAGRWRLPQGGPDAQGASARDWVYIVKKRKCEEDAKHLVTTGPRESRDMMKMPGMISTSAKPGVLVSVMPNDLRDVNGGEMEVVRGRASGRPGNGAGEVAVDMHHQAGEFWARSRGCWRVRSVHCRQSEVASRYYRVGGRAVCLEH